MRQTRSNDWQLVGSHVSPPSHEYCTVYAMGVRASWEKPVYERPSVPTYVAASPGGAQRTSTEACAGLTDASGVAVTCVGAPGSTDGSLRAVTFAFCARLEKLLFRDDMSVWVG